MAADPLETEGMPFLYFAIGLWLMWEWNLVKALFQLVSQVKDEQQYIVMRERTHRNTAESTNARVKWWSIFQLGVLLGEGVFQVWWLKRFFEVCKLKILRRLFFADWLAGQARSLDSNLGPYGQATQLEIFWILPLDQHFCHQGWGSE